MKAGWGYCRKKSNVSSFDPFEADSDKRHKLKLLTVRFRSTPTFRISMKMVRFFS